MRFLILPVSLVIAAVMLGIGAGGCDYSYVEGQTDIVGPVGNTGDTTKNTIELTVTSAQTTLQPGTTEQFTATVTGTAVTGVTWSIIPVTGSISSSGLYTAPATISLDPTVVTVRALSVADTTVSATATITITRAGSGGGGGGDTLLPGQVCFQRDVLPIFQSNCTMSNCHDAVTRQKGYNFTSYSSIIASAQREDEGFEEILEKITEDRSDKRMPPPPKTPLTAEQIATIRKWIEQGAKETRCSDTDGNGCDTLNVTFSATIRPILQNNCVGCHSGTNPPLGVSLDSYSGVLSVVNDGRFRKAVNHLPGASAMPKGGNKLPDCTVNKINAWLNKGASNN
jgi:mono/diheme cytochrome c family protein